MSEEKETRVLQMRRCQEGREDERTRTRRREERKLERQEVRKISTSAEIP